MQNTSWVEGAQSSLSQTASDASSLCSAFPRDRTITSLPKSKIFLPSGVDLRFLIGYGTVSWLRVADTERKPCVQKSALRLRVLRLWEWLVSVVHQRHKKKKNSSPWLRSLASFNWLTGLANFLLWKIHLVGHVAESLLSTQWLLVTVPIICDDLAHLQIPPGLSLTITPHWAPLVQAQVFTPETFSTDLQTSVLF